MKLFISLIILILSLGCKNEQVKQNDNPQPNFTSFEMSFRGGWIGGFSFFLDSSHTFFAPPMYVKGPEDTVKYGALPDSILQIVNQTVILLQTDTTIKSTGNNCSDCSLVAIRAITAKDTIQVFQAGLKISPPLMGLIRVLDSFINNNRHKTFNSLMLLETAKQVSPPPPPPVK